MLFVWLILVLADFGHQVSLVVICLLTVFYECLDCLYVFVVVRSLFYSTLLLSRSPMYVLVNFDHQVAVGCLK
jgi:hypothetical protein